MAYGNYGLGGLGSNSLEVVPTVAPYNPLVSAQVGQMIANTNYTNTNNAGLQATQAAQAQAATDSGLVRAAAQKAIKWTPAGSNVVQAPDQAGQGTQAPADQAGQPINYNSLSSQTNTTTPAQPVNYNTLSSQSNPAAPQNSPSAYVDPNSARAGKYGISTPAAPVGTPVQSYPPLTPASPSDPKVLSDPVLSSIAGAHNTSDTSMAVGSNPTFNAVQTYSGVGPDGKVGNFTVDRTSILQDLLANGRGDLADGLVSKWTDADLQSEKAKQTALVNQHAQLAGMLSAFQALPNALKPGAYQSYVTQMKQDGIDPSAFGLPATYDPTNKDSVAAVSSFAEQAKTVADRDKENFEAVNATLNQQKDNETARHDKADEYLKSQQNRIEAFKASQAVNALSGSNLVGPAFVATLDPSVVNTLKGVATGTLKLPGRGAQTSQLLIAAHQAFSDVDIAGAQKLTADLGASNAGTSGGIAEGSNKTLEHIGVMMGADQAAGGAGNWLPNWAGSALNATENAVTGNNARNAWDAAHSATLNEMARSFKGGPPGENEVIRDMKTLSYSDTQARKQRVYQAYSDLLQGQTGAVESQRKAMYGQLDPGTSLLTSKAQQVYSALHGGSTSGLLPAFDAAGAGQGGQAPGQAPSAQAPGALNSVLSDAKTAIAQGAPRAAVLARAKAHGFDLTGKL